ncbi:MAG: spore coat U domain-containing protein [Sphingomonas sp.]
MRNIPTRGAIAPGAALLMLAAAGPAGAATTGSTLNVSANVTSNCTVSTSALAFGSVNVIGGGNVDGSGGLTVTCTSGTAWSAAAGVGAGTGASFASRRMTAGSNQLGYNLYTSSGYSTVWGDGTGGTSLLSGTGTGGAQSVAVYGRVGSGQASVPAGSYADTVAITVTY